MNGVYILDLEVETDIDLEVGALGIIHFESGRYLYVGSAQNSLEKRIERHLSDNKKLHWHIDYLLSSDKVSVNRVFYKVAGRREECEAASCAEEIGSPIKNFGSSDCNCASHLYKVKSPDFIQEKGYKVYDIKTKS